MGSGQAITRRQIVKTGGAALLAGMAAPFAPALAAESGALTPVEVVNTSGNIGLILTQMLKQLDYLGQFGIAPSYTNVSDGTKVIGALLSGSADVCAGSGFSGVFPAVERGGTLKLIAGASLLTDQAVFSAKPDVKSVKDLIGRTVATGAPGALVHQLMVALLHKKGIDPKLVTFVNVGSNVDVFKAVTTGTVDAGPSAVDVYYEQEKYGVHSLTDGDLWSELPEFTNQAAYTSDQAIKNKRDVLVRVLAANIKLFRFLQSPESKEAFIKARLIATGKDEPQEAIAQWSFFQKYKPYALDPVLSEERVRYMQALNVELGVQKTILPYEQVADMSIARDALKLAG
jgi:ABC-type nitrate/sulfonate/bicarbonate transport system substrate-binding protein